MGASEDEENPILDEYIHSRKYVRQKITRLCNKIDNNIDSFSDSEKKFNYTKLYELQKEVHKLDTQIYDCKIEDKITPEQLVQCVEEDETYTDRIQALLLKLDVSIPFVPPVNDNIIPGVANKLRLPIVPLPQFSNDKNENFEKFIYSFESIIDKHQLTPYEKFIYLKNQLDKSPKILVESLEADCQTFDNAKELLTKAFASSVTQKYSAIKRLAELKLSPSGDPYSFIGEIRTITSSFHNLKIDVQSVLTYFIWNACNEQFQNHMIQIVNTTKPSLQQIEANIFEATERYVRSNDKQTYVKNKPKLSDKEDKYKEYNNSTNNYAVNVKSNKGGYNICNLCKHDNCDFNHKMIACPVYETPAKKVNKIRDTGGCIRCSFKSHTYKNCKFKFLSKCRNCNLDHMTFLCLKTKPPNKDAIANINWTEAFSGGCGGDILLPTLSCEIVTTNRNKIVRILKDSGCQRNFICESLVNEYKFPVVEDNVNLTIHGFNSSKNIKTKVVNIDLKFGDKTFNIEAISIPKIRTLVKLPKLGKLAESFIDKGYKLADDYITKDCDLINNIDLVLGADTDHNFDMKYRSFGPENNKSCYLETPKGVVFTGNIDRLINNVDTLPLNYVNGDAVAFSNILTNKIDFADCSRMVAVDEVSVATSVSFDNGDQFDSGFVDAQLEKATGEALEQQCNRLLNYDQSTVPCDNELTDTNMKLVENTLKHTQRNINGRLKMPIMWNAKICHRLGQNYVLSKQILNSNLKKLKKTDKLKLYDEVFREQEREGIIERIDDIHSFIRDHPEHSFMPHMAVFKPDRQTVTLQSVG